MALVYLIPLPLHSEGADFFSSQLLEALRDCHSFFAENERTARRFFKKAWKEMVIDDYEWHTIHKREEEALPVFREHIRQGKTIGIVSEAGCPGIADPGQALVALAQELGAELRPLTGPNSIVLALMASGLNGQHFQFLGYLPIDAFEREKKIRELEQESARKNCTQIFIETPYRNQALLEALLRHCRGNTRLCIARSLTAPGESIRTAPISWWKMNIPTLAKEPAIFLFHAS